MDKEKVMQELQEKTEEIMGKAEELHKAIEETISQKRQQLQDMHYTELGGHDGQPDVPDYMISGSRGDFSGVGDIHFFYSADEVLYGALPDFEAACAKAGVPCTAFARPGMVHCYCMLPCFKEAKEDFAKITDILRK